MTDFAVAVGFRCRILTDAIAMFRVLQARTTTSRHPCYLTGPEGGQQVHQVHQQALSEIPASRGRSTRTSIDERRFREPASAEIPSLVLRPPSAALLRR